MRQNSKSGAGKGETHGRVVSLTVNIPMDTVEGELAPAGRSRAAVAHTSPLTAS
jgi:hypothetical protein